MTTTGTAGTGLQTDVMGLAAHAGEPVAGDPNRLEVPR